MAYINGILSLSAFLLLSAGFVLAGFPDDIVPLFICLSWWGCSLAHKFATGRRLANDAVPVLLGFWLPARWAFLFVRKIWRFGAGVSRGRSRGGYTYAVKTWREMVSDRPSLTRAVLNLQLPIGYNNRRVVYVSLTDDRHLAIMGTTGEGKTSVALTMITSIMAAGQAGLGRINISLHDPKRVISGALSSLSHMPEFRVVADVSDSRNELERLVKIMNQRTQQLGENGVFSIDELGLPRILVVIDEPQIYFHLDKEYESLVYQLVTVGRQAGIHVVLVTPYAKGDVISTKYRVNLKFVSGYLPAHAETVLRMPVSQLGPHEFLYQKSERATPIHLSSFDITGGDIAAIASMLTAPPVQVSTPTAAGIALRVFTTTPNCGVRTLLRNSRMIADASGSVPYPLDGVKLNGSGVSYSKESIEWAMDFLKKLEDKGIASSAPTGKSRTSLVSFDKAKEILKKEIS